jgi:Histidine kinase-, DNA gyrase B-, and HSP90-like ATPase
MQEINVEVRPDFLERQAKAPPVQALAELIWNALDADATAVNVDFEHDALGGMSKIVVGDNGHGMPLAEARQLFKNFGGSWKRSRASTQGLKRILHGREGRGRFKAFALGGVVDWKVIYNKDGSQFRYDISVLESEIARVRISDEQPVSGFIGRRHRRDIRTEAAIQFLKAGKCGSGIV